ncbi:MAG: helix-turn-helix transcriptional regulator [Pseudomonadota bacterium]
MMRKQPADAPQHNRKSNQFLENQAGYVLAAAIQTRDLSVREVARRAGTSHATLIAYIKGRKSPSLSTLARIVDACDLSLDVALRPRVRGTQGLPRGEELAQVLRLAEQFPARPHPTLAYPKFPRRPLWT